MFESRHARGAAALATIAGAVGLRRSMTSQSGAGDPTAVLDGAGVRRLYDRIAPIYDLAASPYALLGGRRLAECAIAELRLQPGDTVVDLGTGTGWNLPRLADRVGPTGTVIGVDISPGMLERARKRVASRPPGNVRLVEADISGYGLPADTVAVISTFAIEMLPDYREVIGNLSLSLGEQGRIVTTGLRNPDDWPEPLIRIASRSNRLFGVSEDYRDHRPWEAVDASTTDTLHRMSHAGAVYLAAGTTSRRTASESVPRGSSSAAPARR